MALGTLEVVMHGFLSLCGISTCNHADSSYEKHVLPRLRRASSHRKVSWDFFVSPVRELSKFRTWCLACTTDTCPCGTSKDMISSDFSSYANASLLFIACRITQFPHPSAVHFCFPPGGSMFLGVLTDFSLQDLKSHPLSGGLYINKASVWWGQQRKQRLNIAVRSSTVGKEVFYALG